MSFFEDIEKDINDDIISDTSSAKLYGYYDIKDVHNTNEFIQYIIDISCIKEAYDIIINNQSLSSIETYNNDYYTYTYDEGDNSYYVLPINEGVSLHIRIINYNKGKDKTLSFGMLNNDTYFYLSEIDILYNNMYNQFNSIKETLTQKISAAFKFTNDKFIEHIQYNINHPEQEIRYYDTYFENIVNIAFMREILEYKITNIKYIIDLCIYLIQRRSTVLLYSLIKTVNDYIMIWRFICYKPCSTPILSTEEQLILHIMHEYDIFDHINFFQFRDSILKTMK